MSKIIVRSDKDFHSRKKTAVALILGLILFAVVLVAYWSSGPSSSLTPLAALKNTMNSEKTGTDNVQLSSAVKDSLHESSQPGSVKGLLLNLEQSSQQPFLVHEEQFSTSSNKNPVFKFRY